MSKNATKSTSAKTQGRINAWDLETYLCRASRKMQWLRSAGLECDHETLCDLVEDVATDIERARAAFYGDHEAEKGGTR